MTVQVENVRCRRWVEAIRHAMTARFRQVESEAHLEHQSIAIGRDPQPTRTVAEAVLLERGV